MDSDERSVVPSGDGQPEERLESWKAIAAYLGRGVTTVQRWERDEKLPVRRHGHASRGSVFAFRRELDDWRRSRESTGLPSLPQDDAVVPLGPDPGQPRAGRYGARIVAIVISVAAVLALAAIWRGPKPGATQPLPRALVAVALTTGPASEDHPSLSPDGRQVVYAVADDIGSRLFVRSTEGGPPRELITDAPRPAERVDDFPRWSPNGAQIAFLRETRNSIWELRIVAASGGTSRTLLIMATGAMSWLPDGNSLVVLDRPSQTEPFSAYLVAASTGARLRRVTTPSAGTFGDWQCDVSPNGRELAVVRYQSSHHADVWVVDIESGAERRLTTGMQSIEGVAWLPDGQAVVFSAADQAASRLWTIASHPRTGERPSRVSGAKEVAKSPTVARSPVGRAAAVAFVSDETRASLWRWDRRSTAAASRLTTSRLVEEQPALSPDGRRIAFTSSRSGAPEIWVDAIDGSAPRQLTFRKERVAMPRWSPDGTYIVYTSWTGDNQDLFSIRSDGSGEAWRVTFEPSVEDNPSWSRDGESIYFRSDRDGRSRIYRMPGSGGQAVAMTRGEGSQALESLDGTRLYFVRSRTAPGLWSMPVTGGPESFVAARVWEGWWDVTAQGVVAWQHEGRAQTEPVSLRLYDQRGSVRDLGTLPSPFSMLRLGVSADRDANVLVWATYERPRSGIMVARQ
jgi:Tol biopolymer transport system component